MNDDNDWYLYELVGFHSEWLREYEKPWLLKLFFLNQKYQEKSETS